MKYILGRKQEMVQFFNEDGKAVPATVIAAGPVTITQVKTNDTDGYDAVQIGYGTQDEKRIPKARLGQMKGFGPFRHLKEFRIKDGASVPSVGESLTVDQFTVGDTVQITGVSKGKGFQGVVKRHGFAGGPRSHGQKHSEREPGSIGGGLRNRVPKGMRMAGRMGGDTISIRGLKVIAVDAEKNVLLVKGAIPGRRGSLVSIKA